LIPVFGIGERASRDRSSKPEGRIVTGSLKRCARADESLTMFPLLTYVITRITFAMVYENILKHPRVNGT
jgi:hypothetical protein